MRSVYTRENFEKVWQESTGGVAYIYHPQRHGAARHRTRRHRQLVGRKKNFGPVRTFLRATASVRVTGSLAVPTHGP